MQKAQKAHRYLKTTNFYLIFSFFFPNKLMKGLIKLNNVQFVYIRKEEK